MQGSIMVHGHCPSPHCHLSIKQVSFKCQQEKVPDRQMDGQTDGQSGDSMGA